MAQAETVTVNAGTPWAVKLPRPEPPSTVPAGSVADAQSDTGTPASEPPRRRRKRPKRPASPQPAASASGSPDQTASDARSQQGLSAKMSIAPAEYEYSAGPGEASSGREERRRKAAATEAEAAGEAAEERKDGDGTPAYGPWIGKAKVSGDGPAPCGLSVNVQHMLCMFYEADAFAGGWRGVEVQRGADHRHDPVLHRQWRTGQGALPYCLTTDATCSPAWAGDAHPRIGASLLCSTVCIQNRRLKLSQV